MPDSLIARVRLNYGRGAYLPGERFVAAPADAKTLVATGKAVRDDEPVPALLQPPSAAHPSEPPMRVVDPVAPIEPKRKRGRPRKGEYLTRDMRAK